MPIPYTDLQIASGQAPGYSVMIKGGENPAVGTAYEDIWSYGGTKTLSTAAAAYYISSSSASDTAVTVFVEGLDANWNYQTVSILLIGQTKTEIGSGLTWIDVFRVTNISATALVGIVYVYEDNEISDGVPGTATKVRAAISIGNEITKQAIYPVPAGTRGYLRNFTASLKLGLAKTGSVQLMMKPFGEVWKARHAIGFSGSADSDVLHTFSPHFEMLPKTFIKLRVKLSAEDEVDGGFGLILIKQGGL